MIVKIGNENFILKKKDVNFVPYRKSISLLDCYEKPSQQKIDIFQYWKTWFNNHSESENDFLSIGSYNFYMFTLNGVITINGNEYYFLITKTRKEIYKKIIKTIDK